VFPVKGFAFVILQHAKHFTAFHVVAVNGDIVALRVYIAILGGVGNAVITAIPISE